MRKRFSISVSLPKKVLEVIDKRAAELGLSRNELIRYLIIRQFEFFIFFDKDKKKRSSKKY